MWLVPEKAIIAYSFLGLVQNKALEAEAIREGIRFRTVDTRLSDHLGIPRTKLELGYDWISRV